MRYNCAVIPVFVWRALIRKRFVEATPEQIPVAALKLPEIDRLVIANSLMDTLPDDLAALSVDDPDLLDELDRRWQNRDGTIPWRQLRDEWPTQ